MPEAVSVTTYTKEKIDELIGDFAAVDQALGGDLAGTLDSPTIGAGVLGDANWDASDPLGRDKVAAVETPHRVGAVGEPAFEAGWQHWGSDYVQFWRDDVSGLVHLEGFAQYVGDAPANSVIFTLPEGYRCVGRNRTMLTQALHGTSYATATVGLLQTSVLGAVWFGANLTGPGAIVYLDGLHFRVT